MTLRAILVTLALTVAAVLLIVQKLGPGGPLYLATLSESALWLLPTALALATPAGAFGGILLTRTRQGDAIDQGWADDTARLAVLALLVSALTVGWLVPLSLQETEALSRFQADVRPLEQREVRLEGRTLGQLFVELDSVPGAGQELLRRAAWIVPSFVLPLVAGVLAKLRSRWTQGEAALATVMLFIISARLATGF